MKLQEILTIQANLIKHQTLQIDGKLTGFVLSQKEFHRVLKIVESISSIKTNPIRKKKSEISSAKIKTLKFKNIDWKFISLDHLPKKSQTQILNKIESLTNQPNFDNLKYVNSEFYRIKSDDYRIIFSVDEFKKKIRILEIIHRKNAYK